MEQRARSAVDSFATKIFSDSKEKQNEVKSLLAAYGLRCLISEVPIERLNMEDVKQDGEWLDELISLMDNPATKKKKIAFSKRRPRPDCAQQYPFQDDAAVDEVLPCSAKRTHRYEDLPARDQIRRAKSVFQSLKQGNALPGEFVALALDEVVGRTLKSETHDALVGGRRDKRTRKLTQIDFLRLVKKFLRVGEDQADDDAWELATEGVAAPAPRVVATPTAASLARQKPPAPKPSRPPPAPWRTSAAVGGVSGASIQGQASYGTSAAAPAAKHTPNYLKNAQSKIKKDLDARKAAHRRDKKLAEASLKDLLDEEKKKPSSSSSAPRAVDIANAFLNSSIVNDWNLRGTAEEEDDDTGDPIPVGVDDDVSFEEESTSSGGEEEEKMPPPTQPYTGWLGDYGPLHTRRSESLS